MRTDDLRSFGIFHLIVLVLSFYALTALLLDTFFTLSPQASELIQKFDLLICAVFFIDFCLQLYKAENKMAYLKVGWIDLVASIPFIDALRWGRLFRVVRILRVVRAVRGAQKIYAILKQRQGIGGSVGLLAFMLLVFSSLTILLCENHERSSIKTAGDALWWSITTMTTVGYGDLYPVTTAGRIIGAIVMIGGVGIFGSFTALVASYFLPSQEEQQNENANQNTEMLLELKALRQEIQELRGRLSNIDNAHQ